MITQRHGASKRYGQCQEIQVEVVWVWLNVKLWTSLRWQTSRTFSLLSIFLYKYNLCCHLVYLRSLTLRSSIQSSTRAAPGVLIKSIESRITPRTFDASKTFARLSSPFSVDHYLDMSIARSAAVPTKVSPFQVVREDP